MNELIFDDNNSNVSVTVGGKKLNVLADNHDSENDYSSFTAGDVYNVQPTPMVTTNFRHFLMSTVTNFSLSIKREKVPLFIRYIGNERSELETTEGDERYAGRPYGIKFYPNESVEVLASVDRRYLKGKLIEIKEM